jgi:hypothetical protein
MLVRMPRTASRPLARPVRARSPRDRESFRQKGLGAEPLLVQHVQHVYILCLLTNSPPKDTLAPVILTAQIPEP